MDAAGWLPGSRRLEPLVSSSVSLGAQQCCEVIGPDNSKRRTHARLALAQTVHECDARATHRKKIEGLQHSAGAATLGRHNRAS
jgi:hypothetical protein